MNKPKITNRFQVIRFENDRELVHTPIRLADIRYKLRIYEIKSPAPSHMV